MFVVCCIDYLIPALVDVELIDGAVRLAHAQHHHVLAVRVLVVGDVGDAVQGLAREHPLLLLVRDLDPVLGQGEDADVF